MSSSGSEVFSSSLLDRDVKHLPKELGAGKGRVPPFDCTPDLNSSLVLQVVLLPPYFQMSTCFCFLCEGLLNATSSHSPLGWSRESLCSLRRA